MERRLLVETKVIFKSDEVQRIVFHYNKAHNQDASIPSWVVKHKGQTYYVNHLDSKVGFSTKETPLNETTKASLMFRGKLSIVEQNNSIMAIIK
jgi:hypothetical protein